MILLFSRNCLYGSGRWMRSRLSPGIALIGSMARQRRVSFRPSLKPKRFPISRKKGSLLLDGDRAVVPEVDPAAGPHRSEPPLRSICTDADLSLAIVETMTLFIFLRALKPGPSEPGQAALLVLDVLFDDGDRAPPQVAAK
jgi:hypothetical protein